MQTDVKKLYHVGIFVVLAMCCQSAIAEQLCGKIGATYILTTKFDSTYPNNGGVYCVPGTGIDAMTITHFDTKYEYVCVNYGGILTDVATHIFLQNCNISYYACSENSYYTNVGCTECPDGKAAISTVGYHVSPTCATDICRGDYFWVPQVSRCLPCNSDNADMRDTPHSNNYCQCKVGYYWDDTMCTECPYGGASMPAMPGTPAAVTQCYLHEGIWRDDTGKFNIDGGPCFYEK